MKNKKLFGIFDYKPNYIFILILNLVVLFIAYPIGNYFFDFTSDYQIIKMFLWFSIIYYLSDNIFREILD